MRMKCTRLLSLLLALLMVSGCFSALTSVVFAADDAEETTDAPTEDKEPAKDDEGNEGEEEPGEDDDGKINYLTKIFETPQEKLDTMTMMLDRFGYQLYYETYTGEVAYVEKSTGNIMFTNPIDIPTTTNAKKTKQMLLSQLVVNYSEGGTAQTFYSYTEAAERNQIKVKYIKNGIRVEYTIGEEETRSLVPRMMNAENFRTLILDLIPEGSDKNWFQKNFMLKDPFDPNLNDRMRQEMMAQYKITEQMAVYIVSPDTTDREFDRLEQIIKTYCPLFTYEVLEAEHEIVNYESKEDDPPVFKMSLEYYLDENGLTVRLPANGIRFNESTYSLNYIDVLPYFGCASEEYKGYTFYPDGSGTITRFENLTNLRVLSGQLYGRDYAYHQLTGSNNAQILHMPVFGVVENTEYSEEVQIGTEHKEAYYDSFGDYHPEEDVPIFETQYTYVDHGFVAIIEEGDSLASITSSHGGKITHKYSSVYTTFYPRPTDSYSLSDVISIGENKAVSVTSKRKYTGSYKIRFIMLTDHGLAEEKGIKDYYECSYVGMADAYRDYLEKTGVLTRLTEKDTKGGIPLYVESFGTIETDDTFLTFPTKVDTPLTTFDDLTQMYDKIAEKGITNVNFRLTGFVNGGLKPTVPNGIKFQKALGGNDAYANFVKYAQEKGFGVFPDVDMMYLHNTGYFDGFSFKDDAAQSIDERYIQKRTYDPSYQAIMTTGLTLLSSTIFDKYYANMEKDLKELGVSGLSFGTLGSDLNSDFTVEDSANREESKVNANSILQKAQDLCGNVMVDGGNAYILGHVNHILNATLDSSHFTYADEAVPFVGMVLHGYVNFAGTPTNMAGDSNYEMLKIIENGAAPYFTLSMQNTAALKEDKTLSKYYSVDFGIWFDDMVDFYNRLNEVLGDLQTSRITDHDFLKGLRTPTDLENQYDEMDAQELAELLAIAEQLAKEKAEREEAHKKLMAELNGTAYVPSKDETADDKDDTKDDEQEEVSKYLVDNGMIVYVEYENGVFFILNYNNFEVTVEHNDQVYTIAPISFVRVNP